LNHYRNFFRTGSIIGKLCRNITLSEIWIRTKCPRVEWRKLFVCRRRKRSRAIILEIFQRLAVYSHERDSLVAC